MTETIPEEHCPYMREELPPEDVTPVAAHLLSDAAADVTGVTVTAAGDEIGILSEPRQVRTSVAKDGWTVDAIDEAFDSVTDGYETTRTESFL